jgi:tetratricopeptide (TPR) repeat protein
LVAVSLNKPELALPFFKTALEENSKIEYFWLSYIETLIKLNQLEKAQNTLSEAEKLGFVGKRFYSLSKLLITANNPEDSKAHSNLGFTLQELGRLKEAEVSYRKSIALNPNCAESHFDLGNIFKRLERLEEAEASFRKAIVLKPDYAESHNNLGVTLEEMGRLEESLKSYNRAIELRPDYAVAHNNLGNTLFLLHRVEEAEASFNKAIESKPEYSSAFINRAKLFFKLGSFEAALKDADFCNTKSSRLVALESLYALGRVEEVYQRIEVQSELGEEDIRVAAFASFLSKIEKKDTANNFCNNPIDFVNFSNVSSHLKDSSIFIEELIEELGSLEKIWEPAKKSTRKGFQTPSKINLFTNPSVKMEGLKSIIIDELDSYYLKFKDETCSFIQNWPTKKNLSGWQVVLRRQGYQTAHIHPGGWLSGVIYLKVAPSLGKDEGAIEFNLSGENYSNTNSPKLTYQPEVGDMVFFPSSLHHRTIPFSTNTDRMIVSFDLLPESV